MLFVTGIVSLLATPKSNNYFCARSSTSKAKNSKTYNTRDSPVVTDLSTSLAVAGLSRGERTGSRIFLRLWSYVSASCGAQIYMGGGGGGGVNLVKA